jgi:2-iminobutanoate/2-iminopropanoate deaminase
MTIDYSNPTTVASPDGHFSQAVTVDAATRLLFISGQVSRALDGSTVGVGDMTKQAEQVFENLRAILTAHGSSFNKVVKATLFTTDFSRADEVAAVRQRFYGNAKPASTWVEVRALGDPEWLLEVELIATI